MEGLHWQEHHDSEQAALAFYDELARKYPNIILTGHLRAHHAAIVALLRDVHLTVTYGAPLYG